MSSNNTPQRGRPPKKADEKRIQVNVRLLTADRESLQILADESGKPVATEAENILAKHLTRRKETNELLDRIAVRIEELEVKAQGKWHKNLMAWAAVAEMLTRVLNEDRPERIADDEAVAEVRERLWKAERRRDAIIQLLSDRGISVKRDPRPEPLLGMRARRGILSNAFTGKPPPSPRTWEKAAIDALPTETEADENTKADAQWLFDQLAMADAAVAAEEAEEAEALRPYVNAEQAGRLLAQQPQNALFRQYAESIYNLSPPIDERLAKMIERYTKTGEEGE
jgi:hypothetical protein